MTDSKIKVDLSTKTFEIEGTEEFIDRYWDNITDLFDNPPTITPQDNLPPGTVVNGNNLEPISNLAAICNISVENIKNVLDFDGKKFILIQKIDGKSDADKQVKASLIILTAYYKGLGEEWTSSIKLSEALTTRSVNNKHLADNLKAKSELFKDNGKARRSMSYGLKTQGWQEGVELITKLANGTT